MIPTTVQTYQVAGKLVKIDPRGLYEYTKPTRTLLARLDPQLPAALSGGASLKNRVQPLEETAVLLKKTKDTKLRIMFNGVVKTVIIGFLLSEFINYSMKEGNTRFSDSSNSTFFSLFFAGLLYVFASRYVYFEAKDEITSIEKRLPNYQPNWVFKHDNYAQFIVPPLGGGIVLSFEPFTRMARVQKVFDQQEKLLLHELDVCQEINAPLLSESYDYYKKKAPELLNQLDSKIKDLQNNLQELLSSNSYSQTTKKVLQLELREHQTARFELERLIHFYDRFDFLTENNQLEQMQREDRKEDLEGYYDPLTPTTPLLNDWV